MRLALVLVLLTGCATMPWTPRPRGLHQTPCGMWHDFEGEDALALAAAEARAVEAIRPHVPYICNYLRGWRVEVPPSSDGHTIAAITSEYGSKRWSGTVLCGFGTILVPNADWARNAYAHEMLHLIECPATDNAHAKWTWQWDAEHSISGAQTVRFKRGGRLLGYRDSDGCNTCRSDERGGRICTAVACASWP